jgi:hypothetical protein
MPSTIIIPEPLTSCPLTARNRTEIQLGLEMYVHVSREMAFCGASGGAESAFEGPRMREEMVAVGSGLEEKKMKGEGKWEGERNYL